MGAEQFEVTARGKTAEAAFAAAVADAQHEYGHRGYTGSIAEKRSYKMVTPNQGEDPKACVDRCMSDEKHFSDDKWGPAACVELGPDPKDPKQKVFLFFGWASS